MSGQRGANKALFQADLLICLGPHLPIPHTTTLYKTYAPKSKKVLITIDKNELKNLNVKFDLKICEDVKNFLNWIHKKKFTNNFNWQNKKKYKSMNWYEPAITKKPNSIDLSDYLQKIQKKIVYYC